MTSCFSAWRSSGARCNDLWHEARGGCYRAPKALLKASPSKRLGSRASTAVRTRAAGAREAAGRPGSFLSTFNQSHTHAEVTFAMFVPAPRDVSGAKKRHGAKVCKGISNFVACLFSTTKIGRPVHKPWASQKCLFCDKERVAAACTSVKGRANITAALKAFRAEYDQYSHVYNAAILRIPDERRESFHAKALKEKRGPPKWQAPVSQHAEAAANVWTVVLASRKRAFSNLGSKEVTAYKKRRAADRNRVAKKFFLDNGLPQPAAKGISENDSGLPEPASSQRAAFVEQWCKFGSWAMCKDCHSLQPRPLEPVDTRRVAAAQMTAKACKQCKAKHWVPQPEDIPHPLRKLSVKLSKVLRPLDIEVGPVKKANNGYRIHSSMTRLSWSKKTVEEKIRKARSDRVWFCRSMGDITISIGHGRATFFFPSSARGKDVVGACCMLNRSDSSWQSKRYR